MGRELDDGVAKSSAPSRGPKPPGGCGYTYLHAINQMLASILEDSSEALGRAADRMAEQVAQDRLIHVYGPGGHSNLAAQEVFFRAGGLAPVSAILDEGTLLSNGALRSLSIERTAGYGRAVIRNQGFVPGDLLILVSAYGVNSALIDAALTAREQGVHLIGLNSHRHARECAPDHPSRHASKQNLQDLVDIAVDTKVPPGDALVEIPGLGERMGPASSFASMFTLNTLMMETATRLQHRRVPPPVWRSANAPGGDEANAALVARYRPRMKWL